MSDKLTSQDYWESYYGKRHANKQRIINVCSYYDVFWKKLFHSSNDTQTLIEIGGYPGRYLAYLANKYHIKPTCLDYNSEATHIEEVFKIMDVNEFDILQKDFTTYQTAVTYDYVISNGFIEHFEDFDTILDLHVDYIKNNGRLFVMIPNMKGYVRIYKYFVDYKNLKIHNLNCMNLNVFKNFAKRHNLKIKHLGYYGGFPIGVHQKLNIAQKIIFKVHRYIFKFIFNPFLMKHPSRYFSSSIVAIFEK